MYSERAPEPALVRLSRFIDERASIRSMHRRLQVVAKALIVTTFAEDAMRVLFTYEVQQSSMRQAGWTSAAAQAGLPVISFLVQMSGCLLASWGKQAGCYLLLGWCLWHPFMYSQQTNWEFVLETLTIVGGLLILLSHFRTVAAARQRKLGGDDSGGGDAADCERGRLLPAKAVGATDRSGAEAGQAHLLLAAGRLLVCSVFVFHALSRVHGFMDRAAASFERRQGTGEGGQLERAVRAARATRTRTHPQPTAPHTRPLFPGPSVHCLAAHLLGARSGRCAPGSRPRRAASPSGPAAWPRGCSWSRCSTASGCSSSA